VKMVINGSVVEGPWNNEFRIVRGTVWTKNAVAPAGYGLIFVNLYRGGVCIRRVKLLAERYIYIKIHFLEKLPPLRTSEYKGCLGK